ncbi:MAG TPA: hypothetical protein VJG64_04130 [Candidatus Paceibacterota bacterium]
MKSIMQRENSIGLMFSIVMLFALFAVTGVFPMQAHAQFVDTTTPYGDGGGFLGDTNGGYGIFGSQGGFVDTTTPYGGGGYVDTTTPYDYSGYVDTTTPYNYGGYVDTTTPYGSITPIGDTYTPEYSYRPGDTYTPEYSYTPGSTYTPEYSYSTYSPYSSIPSYASQYIPTYAAQYMPSYTIPTFTSTQVQTQRAPTFTTAAPQTQTQSQSQASTNTNVNPNTNTNVNTASTGAITINNTVNAAPVVQAQPQRPIQYTFPSPACTIYASNAYSYNTYNYNQPITLTWSSSNATSAYISPNVGTVNTSGSTTVYPSGYTTYTLTVSGAGGTATCQTTANYAYAAPTYVAPTVATPVAPYVSLTQIPYTGLDYGPVGNAIYWLSMLSFAVAAGYLMVYYRGGAFAFASSMLGSAKGGTRNDSYDFSDDGGASSAVETEASAEVAPEMIKSPITVGMLPTIENRRITTDSMIIESSIGSAPRIVIARG